jgi:LacI family transcriptional regulator
VGGDVSLAEHGAFTQQSGAEAVIRLLDRHPASGAGSASTGSAGAGFDALFAANDQMAAGAIQALRNRGLSSPADVAVVGFDDDAFAATLDPPLTTVRQPATELGVSMTELLVRLISGEEAPHRTIIPTELVRRGTA